MSITYGFGSRELDAGWANCPVDRRKGKTKDDFARHASKVITRALRARRFDDDSPIDVYQAGKDDSELTVGSGIDRKDVGDLIDAAWGTASSTF